MMKELSETTTNFEERKNSEYRELRTGLKEIESFWKNVRDYCESYDYDALDKEVKGLMSQLGINFIDTHADDVNGRGVTTFLFDRAVILIIDRQIRRKTPEGRNYVFVQLEKINLGLYIPKKEA
ncbi:MAG: hypothetical protein M1161_00570 [Candidatus Thermoplasmatota archaeon]|jgi:hypothetical protein|nr:hypothetical protein [Candidatus Thermoplasmatota archaeon]